MTNSQLEWFAKHRVCPRCRSDDVEYEADNRLVFLFKCMSCGWKLENVHHQDVYATSLKCILVREVIIETLNEEGEIASRSIIEHPNTEFVARFYPRRTTYEWKRQK